MSKFLAYYNIYSMNDLHGIAADREERHIIATLGKNFVVVINLNVQKPIRSWSMLDKLSSNVVYDNLSQKYVGVFGNTTIRRWDENTLDVNKCKKYKFRKNIAELVNVECENDDDANGGRDGGGGNTFVLFADGTCIPLAAAIETRKNDVDKTQEQTFLTSNLDIKDVKITKLHDGARKMLTYFEKSKTQPENSVQLVCNIMPEQKIVRFNLNRENTKSNLSGYAVIEGDGGAPTLVTIWSDKSIFMLNLRDCDDPHKLPGDFVATLTAVNVNLPLSILSISRHLMAIYGANINQDGASLLLYNTQFKVIKAKQHFKIYLKNSQMWSMEDKILLSMGQNLSILSYKISKEQLLDLMGTQINATARSLVELDTINEEDPLYGCFKLVDIEILEELSAANEQKSSKVSMKTDDEEMEAANTLHALHDWDTIQADFNDFEKMPMQIELMEIEQSLKDVQISIMNDVNDMGFNAPEIEGIFRHLNQQGASEHEISEKLLTLLIKANLPLDIATCLRRFTNVPEKILTDVIDYALRGLLQEVAVPVATAEAAKTLHKVKKSKNKKRLTQNGISSEQTEQKDLDNTMTTSGGNQQQNIATDALEDCLNLALAIPFDSQAISQHVRRKLDYAQVTTLLEHLYKQLDDIRQSDGTPNVIDTPFGIQGIQWFGVLLNTHFQKLVMAKDVPVIECLFKWNDLLTLYRQQASDLEAVRAFLYKILQRKTIAVEKTYSKWYSIEEVRLW